MAAVFPRFRVLSWRDLRGRLSWVLSPSTCYCAPKGSYFWQRESATMPRTKPLPDLRQQRPLAEAGYVPVHR